MDPVADTSVSATSTPADVSASVRRCAASASSAGDSVLRASRDRYAETPRLTTIETAIATMPKPSDSMLRGWASRRADSKMMIPAPTRIRMPSSAEARFSTFSWPYMWLSSAGSSALRIEKKATNDASRSMLEWTASVTIAIEPVAAPATSFRTIRTVFEAIDTRAARSLRAGSGRTSPVGGCAAGWTASASPRLMPPALRRSRATPPARAPRARGG